MSVRAKFFCSEKRTVGSPGSEQTFESFTFVPVTGGSEENNQFFKWTPSGKLELGVLNPAAAAQFEVGKSYYIDFTPAE